MTTTDIEKAGDSGGEVELADEGGAIVPASGGGDDGDFTRPTALFQPSSTPHDEALRTRVVIPLLLPIVSAAAIFFYVVNLSRALLAGGEWGSLVIASILVLVILGVVAWISAHPNLRTSTLAVMVAVLFLFIGAAGLTTLGPSEAHEEAEGPAFVEPTGDPVATIDVVAESTLKFDADNYDTAAGVNEIVYVLGGGFHTLVFTEKEFAGFELEVSDAGKQRDAGKVELAAGETYTIYCTIPGHRASGMEATITVS
jgi:plastocyanin